MLLNPTSIAAYKAQVEVILYASAALVQDKILKDKTKHLSVSQLLSASIKRNTFFNQISRLHGCLSWSELLVHSKHRTPSYTAMFLKDNIITLAAEKGLTVDAYVTATVSPEAANVLFAAWHLLPSQGDVKNEYFFIELANYINSSLVAITEDLDRDGTLVGYALADLDGYLPPDNTVTTPVISGASSMQELDELVKEHFSSLCVLYLLDCDWTSHDPLVKKAYQLS
ncbi:hypothetical protein [Photobacterium leiognathi]|uniref:hypothetical protein n=1 Tax=Photobacterium leiognathi TaxID=553611 RepID=UPI002980CC3E|nr:hypothetical protein [Photobacterium leiognathi]